MLSVHNDATEKKSAEKTARRGFRLIFPFVLLFCALICALGAILIYRVYIPSEYSESEVNEYVKSIYGDSWKLQKKTALSSEKGSGIQYLYAGGEGGSFSVFVISVPVYENGKATGRWEKALSDNYFSTVIEKNMDALKKLQEKTGKDSDVRLEIEKTGEDSGMYGAAYTFRIYLEETSGFSKTSEIIAKMDKMFSFICMKGTPPYDQMRMEVPSIRIYLKPEKSGPAADVITSSAPIVEEGDIQKIPNLTTDWSAVGEREKYRISTIYFTDAQASSRLKKADVFTRIENDYVDMAKTTGSTFYAASAELRDKYPAPVLKLVNVAGHDISKNDDSIDVSSTGADSATAELGGEDSEEDESETGDPEGKDSEEDESETGDPEKGDSEEEGSETGDPEKGDSEEEGSETDDSEKEASEEDSEEDSEKDDSETEDSEEDDSEKDDSEADDPEKGDSEEDDSEKDDSETDDPEKDDSETYDSETGDSEGSDSQKADAKKKFSYQFVYHRATGTYWLIGLDPCEDFDGNPFGDYPRRGAFAGLINYLGGTYTCEDWKASWKIGDNRWTAAVETRQTGKSSYTYKDISLFKNGNHVFLDEVPELFEGAGAVLADRPYSIRDVIRMLNVRITINQKDMTAVMFRDF